MRVSLKPSLEQARDLEQFLEAQRDPSSSDYQRWLTPEEYGERFGVRESDLEQVSSWLESEGFTVEKTARARNWIAFSGSAGQAGKTFRTELRRYDVDGEKHFANATEPSIPQALAGLISEIHGLHDFRLKPPRAKKITPSYTTSGGTHYLAPDDLAAIYDISALYKAGYDGTGQKLVILGQTDINLADMRGFRATFGLAAKDPQLVLYGPDPGVSSGDQIESDLDLQWAGAVARNANIIFVYSRDVMESAQYAIDQNIAPVISMSYGGCEQGVSASNRTVVQQANAEGITWMNSSGDSGAAGCDWGGPAAARYGPMVTFPADIPEITAVGGTEFNESGGAGWSSANGGTYGSATGYIAEKGWNDTALGGGIWASGGGVSTVFPKPWWQAGPGVPNDNGRDVPDVSLTASGNHDGYLLYVSGQLMAVGGTSASSPAFAGIVAIVNQYLVAKGVQTKPGLGNINPTLYSMAQNTTGIIHDITVGDNIVPCVSKSAGCTTGSFGYKAGVGYDLVTGVGTVDAYNLVTKWASLPASIGTTMTLTALPTGIAQSASTQVTAKVTAVTGSNPPSGSVSFLVGGASLGSAAVTLSGTTATALLTVKGTSLSAGNNSITATYAPSGNFSTSTGAVTVTVTVPAVTTKTVVTTGAASVASNGTEQLTATVTAASGSAAPGGTVTFLSGTTSLGTGALAALASNGAATATLSVAASKLVMGANSITASYAGVTAFSGSISTAVTVTVTAPPLATTATLTANPASIAQSGSTVLTITVKAANGTVSPTGTVAFLAGAASLGVATLAGSGGTATASLTVTGTALSSGSNALTASYAGDGKFSDATGSVTVTMTLPVSATTTVATASPASIAATETTAITATVKATTGAALPTGPVTFALGATSLGSVNLGATAGGATATLSVAASKLKMGTNSITASYAGVTGFTASTGSVNVVVTAPLIVTTTALTASPIGIAPAATTQLTATVRAASGTPAPSGSVTFTSGNLTLGSTALTASGATGTAILTVKGSSLVAGANTITATYSGSAGFSASAGMVTVTVTGSTALASNVVVTATKATSSQQGFPVKIQLQEMAGGATTITGFTINGTNFSTVIAGSFGSAQLAAHATESGTMVIQWSPLPATLVFVVSGADPSGRQWSQTVSLATK